MERLADFFSTIRTHRTVFSFFLVFVILLYAQSIYLDQKNVKEQKAEAGETLGKQEVYTPTATPVPVPTEKTISTPQPNSMNTPTPAKISGSKNILSTTEFFYPGASQISLSEEKLVMESSDDSDKITSWYKSKIQSLGMNAKSFVTTKTNGNVLNKLVGDGGNIEIRVEIQKKNNEVKTKIIVVLER